MVAVTVLASTAVHSRAAASIWKLTNTVPSPCATATPVAVPAVTVSVAPLDVGTDLKSALWSEAWT